MSTSIPNPTEIIIIENQDKFQYKFQPQSMIEYD